MYATIEDLKNWLRIIPNPSFDPIELDGRLLELLMAAIAHVETATGATFTDDTPERINLAVKFLAGYWFENPIPTDKETQAALDAVNILIAAYRVWSFAG